jgi:hypothetical protein
VRAPADDISGLILLSPMPILDPEHLPVPVLFIASQLDDTRPMVKASLAATLGKFEDVEDHAVLLADFLESVAKCNSARADVIRIGDDLKPVEPEIRGRDFARQGDRAGRNTTAAVWGISPVREVRGSVAEGAEFTASEEFAVGVSPHRESKPAASEALSFPSSDDILGVLERRNEVVGELEAAAVLGITVGFEQHTGVTRHKKAESDDAIAPFRHSRSIAGLPMLVRPSTKSTDPSIPSR